MIEKIILTEFERSMKDSYVACFKEDQLVDRLIRDICNSQLDLTVVYRNYADQKNENDKLKQTGFYRAGTSIPTGHLQ